MKSTKKTTATSETATVRLTQKAPKLHSVQFAFEGTGKPALTGAYVMRHVPWIADAQEIEVTIRKVK